MEQTQTAVAGDKPPAHEQMALFPRNNYLDPQEDECDHVGHDHSELGLESRSSGLRARVAGWKNHLLASIGVTRPQQGEIHSHEHRDADLHHNHDHEHDSHTIAAESQISRRKVYGRAAGATALLGAVEFGVETWKYKQGLPVSSVVALDSEHNLALDTLYYLSLAGMEAKGRLGRLASRLTATTALVVGGGISMVNAVHSFAARGIGEWHELGSGLSGSPMLAAVGNTAITGYILHNIRRSKNPDDIEGGDHAKNDRNIAVGKALGSVVHDGFDKAAGLIFGLKDLGLGVRRVARSLQGKPVPQHEHGHAHGHHHEDTDDGQEHNHGMTLADVREKSEQKLREIREIGVSRWLGCQAVNAFSRGGNILKNAFTKETDTGERRVRRGTVAVTALGAMVVGAYLTSKLGVSGDNPHSQARGDSLPDVFGGMDALDPPAVDQAAPQGHMPQPPPTVRLQAGSDIWTEVSRFAGNVQEHDVLADLTRELNGGLTEHDATQLPVDYELRMPTADQIEYIRAAY